MVTNFDKLIRVGIVQNTIPSKMKARVLFEDENLVSDELAILCHGSHKDKDYWMPDVGEQVLCVCLPNGRNTGFIVGAFYSEADAIPEEGTQTTRVLRHNGDLLIDCTGQVTIKGSRIDLNP